MKEKNKSRLHVKLWNKAWNEIDEQTFYKWEILRRNEEYKKDFQRSDTQDLSQEALKTLFCKWHLPFNKQNPPIKLPNPNLCIERAEITPGISLGDALFKDSNDRFQMAGISYWYYTSYGFENRIDLNPTEGKEINNIKGHLNWEIYNLEKGTHEKITSENYPKGFVISVRVRPPYQKTKVKDHLIDEFNSLYDTVMKIQKEILKSVPSYPRLDEIPKYLMVYDKKAENVSWSAIAKELFPEEIRTRVSPHRKKVTKLVLSSTRDKVRYYWRKANYYINEDGWKELGGSGGEISYPS